MGVDSKTASAPPLPAPTETDSTTPTELATDVSKPGDEKSSYSLPEDGTPVTIKTRGHKPSRSQTSLLIEYFEGSKSSTPGSGGPRKPSVRVRLTPSKNRNNDHIQITETKSTRKASLTRRSTPQTPTRTEGEGHGLSALSGQADGEDAKSMSSYASATEESNVSRNPIEVEIDRGGHHRRRRPASPLIPPVDTSSRGSYQPGTTSEISAIPTDSFLDGSGPTKTPEGKRSRSPSRTGDVLAGAAAGLAAAAAAEKIRPKIRSEDKEKLVVSKSKDKDRSERKSRSSKSRTSSVGDKDGVKTPRRRSSRGHHESAISAADSSIVSSGLSGSHRSYDQQSIRSGASKSSINNPKLLETVEDAIRRLILPELNALKREQSRKERRSSATSSGTSASRDDYAADRRKSGGSERPTVMSKDSASRIKESRGREARHDFEESSEHSADQISVESRHGIEDTPQRSGDMLKGIAAGAAVSGIAAAVLQEKSPVSAREQRRRRRAEANVRSFEREVEEESSSEYLRPVPPMPLMSEINPSEVTRTSILSAETDRPHSASEELTPVQEISRGVASAESSPTPTRNTATLRGALGTQHPNISHGDLKALPRTGDVEYQEGDSDVEEYGHHVPIQHPEEYDEEEYDEMTHMAQYPQHGYDSYYGTQVVPAPLKYVPYQPERRGLSPIPSVSGYTEGGSEHANRDSRVTTTTTSSPDKSPQRERGVHSPSSVPSNVMSREFEDDRSLRSSGVDYRSTQYTDDSELGHVTSGQAVRGVGANPNFVNSPIGVESAVASLVDGSMLEDSVLTGESGYGGRELQGHRGSMDTLEEEERSHGQGTPSGRSAASHRSAAEELDLARASPATTRTNPSEFAGEYDIDQYGRKVQRSGYRQSPTASEAAITAGAARLAIENARRKQPTVEDDHEPDWVPAGVQRNKSFKERTLDGRRPANTPTHSVDRLDEYDQPKMGASAVPDLSNPMPEMGHFRDDDTNPSVVDIPIDDARIAAKSAWAGDRTPTQREPDQYASNIHAKGSGPDVATSHAAAAAVLATAAALASSHHSRQPSQDQDDWQRSSDDRKRDTLLTNPYEGASPVVNLPTHHEDLFKSGYGGIDYGDDFSAPSPAKGADEGYISQVPAKSPDVAAIKGKGVGFAQPGTQEDPFYTPKHTRHFSGMSQGMASPLYDAATGAGIDRIENKDIIALMQHLMVRDAQRSARDTEILVTLVRAAAEMRNSFENVKSLLATQEKGIHTELVKQLETSENNIINELMETTENTVRKHIGGPRPLPGSAARSLQGGSQVDPEDLPAKKRNLFRRALKGLSAKGNNDLGRIEDMLIQLLGEVDTLKAQTAQGGSNRAQSFDNVEPEVQFEQDRGYEPEGHAGTSTASHASQSGHLSLNSRAHSQKFGYERKFSDHRISTVPEANEEEYDHPDPNADISHFSNPDMLAPKPAAQRGSSVPLATPPQTQAPQMESLSNENTPRTDKGKKHKSSGSSSWRKISRWSETTASSVGKAFGVGKDTRKEHDLGEFHSGASRSGSDLAAYDGYPRIDPEGEDKLHSGFSEPDLHQPIGDYEAPLHLIPPHPKTYMTPEDPKYKAHRNSLNLQHPQPRSGQPYRAALESGAEEYDAQMSPRSADWAGSATSLPQFYGHGPRYSDGSAAPLASHEAHPQYWTESPAANQPTGPPRPPKEPLEEVPRATPPKSNRLTKLQKNSPLPYHSVESGYGTATHVPTSYTGSPRLENRNLSGALGVPTRRPSGPRAMTPKSQKSVDSLEDEDGGERRRKRATFGTVNSQESETF